MVDIAAGVLLISDPFLKDPNFLRSVVLLCDYQPEGSIGFILNKTYDQPLGDFVEDLAYHNLPLYYGGPVAVDTIHFLHRCPELITDGIEITDGIFWGGDFNQASELLQEKKIGSSDIRFFIGYSGWGSTQLEEELKTKSWIKRESNQKLVFNTKPNLIWRDALGDLGGEYSQMVNYPLDPQFN